jgi:starch phosphorylase
LAALWPQLKLDREQFFDLARHQVPAGETFSMGILALRNSMGRNAVSELHERVSRRMWSFLWPDRPAEQVPTTQSPVACARPADGSPTARLVRCPSGSDWRISSFAHQSIPDEQLWAVRMHLKRKLAFYLLERVRGRWSAGGYHPVQVVASGVLIILRHHRFVLLRHPKRADLIFLTSKGYWISSM